MERVFVLLSLVSFSLAATLSTDYLPPKVTSRFYDRPSLTPVNTYSRISSPQVISKNAEVPILKYNSDVNVDGSYRYLYETGDGTQAQEEGQTTGENTEARGSFAFVAPDGVQYSITYTAGENGFLPQGAHIPTPPPIPAEILQALEQNAADEARGIVDDGQYHPESDGTVVVQANRARQRTGYKY